MNVPGLPLTIDDQVKILASRAISSATATAAGLRRVTSEEGAQAIGRNGAADYSGILFPYRLPGEPGHREVRLRRDRPDIEYRHGVPKEKGKYITAPGARNMVYFPPSVTVESLNMVNLPVIVTEGELKTLALRDLSYHNSDALRFLPLGLSGVWNWRGTVGKTNGPDGERRDVKGAVADLDRIAWQDRQVVIAFDADISTNDQVKFARAGLAHELRSRGALVGFLEWDIGAGKGVDDWIHTAGPDAVLTAIASVNEYQDWRENLICSTKKIDGEKVRIPKAVLANAITALRSAPEWRGMLQWDEFALRVSAKGTPWSGAVEHWDDQQDRLVTDWLQHRGIQVPTRTAGEAVETVAMERPYHPVRDYLNALQWDGISRLDSWLTKYLGVKSSDYASAVGARFLISAVARILRPGAKADYILVLEGEQGIFKSQAARALFQPWFCDYLPDLGTKDSYLQIAGVWGIEVSELAALQRSSVEKIKNFLAGQDDRYRPPYGRRPIDVKRQNVFIGTTNNYDLPPDETGNRRYWPVKCGVIKIDELKANRDALWAQAVHQFHAAAKWWLDTPELERAAKEEQEKRADFDAWHNKISSWLDGKPSVSTDEILEQCLDIARGHWTQSHKIRVYRSLRAMGWERYLSGPRSNREWRFRPVPVIQSNAVFQSVNQFNETTGTPESHDE